MAKAKHGDTVRLHYTGRFVDGTVFETTEHAGGSHWDDFRGQGVAFGPAQLVIGAGEMPPDFEAALVGLEPGQRVAITIPADRAFGARDEDRVTVVPAEDFAPRELGIERFRVAEGRHRPNKFTPKEGQVWELFAPDGSCANARILEVTEDTITLDANHPLAGQDLVFEIRLVEIQGERA